MAAITSSSATPDEKITAVIQLHIDIAFTDKTAITAFNDEWKHLEQPHLATFVNMRKFYESQFKNILQTGIDQGFSLLWTPELLCGLFFSCAGFMKCPFRITTSAVGTSAGFVCFEWVEGA
ncbi:MAG: hypothetical protein R2795_00560 [Saprospiraceae bacterium]